MISVIIPTHNRSESLKKSIESVLNQTYKNIELIIVSDGSTDNTEQVVKEFQKFYNFIKLISVIPNKGANNARNEGIRLAKGSYIAFLDDDDEWLPSKLENQIKIFDENSEVGLVYSGINVIYEEEKIQYNATGGTVGDLSTDILLTNVIGSTSSVMVKKEVLNKSGLFDTELPAAQDYDLWIRICQNTKVGYVKEPGVNYYNNLNGNQISSNLEKYEYASEIRSFKYSDLYSKLTSLQLREKDFNNYMGLATIALRNNDKKSVLNYSLKAISVKLNIKSIIYPFLSLLPFKWVLTARRFIN